ncbi:periplasmic binding family protein, partial [Vibrio parahaemolyticus V-223/04]
HQNPLRISALAPNPI